MSHPHSTVVAVHDDNGNKTEHKSNNDPSSSSAATTTAGHPSMVYSLSICIAFVALSTWTTLYNKFIFDNVLQSSNCLLLAQNVVTIVFLVVGKALGVVHYQVDMRHPGDWAVGVMYSVNVLAGLGSLMFVNIAMFGALKRCTVIASWVIEFFCTRTATTTRTVPAIVTMVVGTLIASFNDLQFSTVGYILAILSCVTQGAAFELGRRVTSQNKGVCAVLFSNAVVTIIMQVCIMSYTKEFRHLAPSEMSSTLLFHLSLNSLSCLLMNYVIFLNCAVNSPLAHAVTGNIKAVFTTTLGLMMFSTPMNFLGYVGIVGNFVGAGWFSGIKYRHQVETKHHAK